MAALRACGLTTNSVLPGTKFDEVIPGQMKVTVTFVMPAGPILEAISGMTDMPQFPPKEKP